jgi:transcriptional regulator with XRE-family HTH domain
LEHIGSVVTRARRRKKWSQRKLSQVTGLSRSYINAIERGRCTGTTRTWVALARALGFSLDEIFLGEWQQRERSREAR